MNSFGGSAASESHVRHRSQARCMPGMQPRLTAPATNASAPPGIATLPASSPDAGDAAEAYRSGDECLRQLLVFLGSAALCGGDTRRGCLDHLTFAILRKNILCVHLCDHLHRWCSADSEGGESKWSIADKHHHCPLSPALSVKSSPRYAHKRPISPS